MELALRARSIFLLSLSEEDCQRVIWPAVPVRRAERGHQGVAMAAKAAEAYRPCRELQARVEASQRPGIAPRRWVRHRV